MVFYAIEKFDCDRLSRLTHDEVMMRHEVLRKMSGFEKLPETTIFQPALVS